MDDKGFCALEELLMEEEYSAPVLKRKPKRRWFCF